MQFVCHVSLQKMTIKCCTHTLAHLTATYETKSATVSKENYNRTRCAAGIFKNDLVIAVLVETAST